MNRFPGQAANTEFIDAVLSFSRISLQRHLTQLIPKSKAKRSDFHRRTPNPDYIKCKDGSIRKTKTGSPGHKKESLTR